MGWNRQINDLNIINVYATIDKVSINKIITFFLAKECFEPLAMQKISISIVMLQVVHGFFTRWNFSGRP